MNFTFCKWALKFSGYKRQDLGLACLNWGRTGATSIQFESYNRIFCADRQSRDPPVKMIIERGLYPTLFYHFKFHNKMEYWWQLSLQNIQITSYYKYLRQGCSLHERVILAGPSSLQSFPPCCGAGLVHVLVLVITPPPHVTLHSDSFHSVYLPSIAKPWKIKKLMFKMGNLKSALKVTQKQ